MIAYELEEISTNLKQLDIQLDTNIENQFKSTLWGNLKLYDLGINPTINYQDNQDNWVQSLMIGLGIAGLTVTVNALLGLIQLVPATVLIGGAVSGATGSLLSHSRGPSKEEIHAEVKRKVCEAGLKEFHKSQTEIFDKICANIQSMYDSRVELASHLIKQAILLYENLLEQQDKVDQESLEQRQQEKAWIKQQRQRLEQVRQEIEAIVREVNP